jgi:hypothetical protein
MIQLHTGDILVCRGKAVVSKGISSATGEWSTHTANVHIIENDVTITDGQKEGAFPRLYDNWIKEFDYDFKVYRSTRTHSQEAFDKFSKALRQMWGKDYAFAHLTVGFWRKLLGGKEVKEKYLLDGKVICTEITMRALTHLGYGVENPHNFTPADVEKYLIEKQFKLVGQRINKEYTIFAQ